MNRDKELARLAIANVEADLVDRRGLKQAWNAIDDHATKCEILGSWVDIVQDAIADARAAGFAEAKAEAVKVLREDAAFCAHHRDQEKKQGRAGSGWTSRIAGVQGCARVIEQLAPAADNSSNQPKEPK